MNSSEYSAMAQVEDHHWWYCGMRSAFEAAMNRISATFCHASGTSTIIDAGCGTGGNLIWLKSLCPNASLVGFDLSPEAVTLASKRIPEANLFVADLCQPAIGRAQPDLILCSDVLYATPLPDGIVGLGRLCQQLTPGGRLLVHLPAYDWMKSRHDESVHTLHRFTAGEVRQMFGELGLQLEFLSYRMFLLFPVLICLRLPSILFAHFRHTKSNRSEIRLPPRPMNGLLRFVIQLENFGLRAGLRYPWGSSLIAVGRKP